VNNNKTAIEIIYKHAKTIITTLTLSHVCLVFTVYVSTAMLLKKVIRRNGWTALVWRALTSKSLRKNPHRMQTFPDADISS